MYTDEQSAYDKFDKAKDAITNQLKAHSFHLQPKVLIICGSGLGGIAKILQGDTVKISYEKIPGFRASTVPGHEGALLFGRIGQNHVPVMCMVGRLHFYEGYNYDEVTFPVRVAARIGVKYMIATNASGGVNLSYKPGDLMVISDHINLSGMAGNHPLRGINLDQMGPRFPAMSDAYSFELRYKFFGIVKKLGIKRSIHEGTYMLCCGPSFETTAECRMIRALGGDCVGMSTVPEIIVGRHCGLECFGLSLITNNVLSKPPPNALDAQNKGLTVKQVLANAEQKTNHAEVLREGKAASEDVNVLMEAFVNEL